MVENWFWITMNTRAQKHTYTTLLDDHPTHIAEDQYFLYALPEALKNWGCHLCSPSQNKQWLCHWVCWTHTSQHPEKLEKNKAEAKGIRCGSGKSREISRVAEKIKVWIQKEKIRLVVQRTGVCTTKEGKVPISQTCTQLRFLCWPKQLCLGQTGDLGN